MAALRPGAAALTCEGETWSFKALNERANRLARHLQAQGVGPGVLVGLHLGRTFDMPLAMLAVMKAGGAYVAVEPDVPEERSVALLKAVGRPVLLARRAPAPALAEQASLVLVLDELVEAIAACSADDLAVEAPPEAIAAVYLTSGSTGEPKPVVYTHRAIAVASALFWPPKPGVTAEGDREAHLMGAPFSFVPGMAIFSALGTGAHTVLAGPAAMGDPLATFELVRAQGVTHIILFPTLWRATMQALDALAPAERARLLDNRLKRILCGGEPITPDLPATWWARFAPDTEVVTMFGQTETLGVTRHGVRPDGLDVPALPLGRPTAGAQVYLLDERMAPVPIGAVGMIYARSDWMSSGYYGHADSFDEKMTPNPFGPGRLCKTGDLGRFDENGDLYGLGRLDHMVKIRGQRVEIGEVEARLRAHPGLKDAVVVGRADGGALGLVAFLVAGDAPAPSSTALHAFLGATLTPAMVPSRFVYLPEMPTSERGKVDHLRLRTMPIAGAATGTECLAPRDEAEKRLLAIWQDVLGFDGFGVTDSFFEVGGDSMKAIHVMARVERSFDRRVPIAVFAATPTIAALASAIAGGATDTLNAHIAPLRTAGAHPPLIMFPPIAGSPETYLAMARLLPTSQPVYACYLVGTQHDLGFNLSLPQLAKVYVEELRREFPGRPLRLGGYSSGALLAYEVAAQLEALGHDVRELIVLDTDLVQMARAPLPLSASEPDDRLSWRAATRLVLRAWQLGYGDRFPNLLPGLLGLKDRVLRALIKPASAQGDAAPALATAPAPSIAADGPLPPLSLSELLFRLDAAALVLLPGGRAAMRRLLHGVLGLPVDQRRAALFDFLVGHTPPDPSLAPLGLPPGRRGAIVRSSYALREAYVYYRPSGRLGATIIAMRAEGGPPDAPRDLGWGALAAGGLHCVDIPGDHSTLMQHPQLDVVVERLWEVLDAAGAMQVPAPR
jgi:amino acid adenylation domain-containing protein